ncbi:fimbrial protein [Enterobacter kobei]
MKKTIILLHIALAIIFYSTTVKAGCRLNDPSMVSVLFDKNIVIPKDLPIGSLIAKKTIAPSGKKIFTECDNQEAELSFKNYNDKSGRATSVPFAFSRNNNGIGIRISNQWSPTGYYGNDKFSSKVHAPSGNVFEDKPITVEIFKTGEISGSTVTLSGDIQADLSESTRENSPIQRVSLAAPVAITQVGCTLIGASSLTIDLGPVPLSIFKGLDTYGPVAPVKNVYVDCVEGTQVTIRLDGVNDPIAYRYLKISNLGSPGVASGVAIKLGYSEKAAVIPINNDFLLWSSTSGGTQVLRLTARYVQTLSTVTPGIANGTATLTIKYR